MICLAAARCCVLVGWRASLLLYSLWGEYLFFIPYDAITPLTISHHKSRNYLSTLFFIFWNGCMETVNHKHPRYYNWRSVAVPMIAGHSDCVSVYWNICLAHSLRTVLTLLTSSGQCLPYSLPPDTAYLSHFLRTMLTLLTSSGQCLPHSLLPDNAYLTHFFRTMLTLLTSSGQCLPFSLPPGSLLFLCKKQKHRFDIGFGASQAGSPSCSSHDIRALGRIWSLVTCSSPLL
jgi:hypothetical protein